MRTTISAMLVLLCAFAGAVAASPPAKPAAKPAEKAPPATGAEGAPAPQSEPEANAGEENAGSMAKIEDILAGEDQVLQGVAYSYDPGNRRDPFKSLVDAQEKTERKGPVPEGIPGLLIDEIDVTGIFRTAHGFVAQVTASNKGKSYLLKEGDQLYDGDVVSITPTEVVFKQIVNDPTVIKPFREVVKKLSP